MMDILLDTIKDTYIMLPLLLLTYIIIEYFDRREKKEAPLFYGLQKYGIIVGALAGIVPQCGFSIIAAMLFIHKNITLGTLLSVFIATSDEAIPVLLANPSLYEDLIMILIMKIALAIMVGYIVDYIIVRNQKLALFKEVDKKETNEACPCCNSNYPLLISALIRALKIFVFLFVTTLVLNVLIAQIGEDNLQHILLSNSLLQPVLAALFGFIPNCAASVVLTQLYVSGGVSFASLFAGLVTNAGLGLIVLFRYQEKKSSILRVVILLLASAIISGMLLQLLG